VCHAHAWVGAHVGQKDMYVRDQETPLNREGHEGSAVRALKLVFIHVDRVVVFKPRSWRP
jgi:hypothetical protein